MLGNATRVLTLDGPGLRVLFQAYFLKQFCIDAKIPIKNGSGILDPDGDYSDLNQYFTLIVGGSSWGSITALLYAQGYSPGYVIKLLTINGPLIYAGPVNSPMLLDEKNTIIDANNFVPVILVGADPEPDPDNDEVLGASSLYGSGDTGRDPNTVLHALLTTAFGESTLNQLKCNVIIPLIEYIPRSTGDYEFNSSFTPLLVSNMKLPGLINTDLTIVDIAMAINNTPIYFPAFLTTSMLDPQQQVFLIDGIHLNNPAGIALTIANVLTQDANANIALLSVGTGIGTLGFFETGTAASDVLGNFDYMTQVVSMTSIGAGEMVNKQLQWMSYFNKNLVYLRFQTIFNPANNTELDILTSSLMQTQATTQYQEDLQKIIAFIHNANFK